VNINPFALKKIWMYGKRGNCQWNRSRILRHNFHLRKQYVSYYHPIDRLCH